MRAAPDPSTTPPSQSSGPRPEGSRRTAKATIRTMASAESHMGGSLNHRDTFDLYPDGFRVDTGPARSTWPPDDEPSRADRSTAAWASDCQVGPRRNTAAAVREATRPARRLARGGGTRPAAAARVRRDQSGHPVAWPGSVPSPLLCSLSPSRFWAPPAAATTPARHSRMRRRSTSKRRVASNRARRPRRQRTPSGDPAAADTTAGARSQPRRWRGRDRSGDGHRLAGDRVAPTAPLRYAFGRSPSREPILYEGGEVCCVPIAVGYASTAVASISIR